MQSAEPNRCSTTFSLRGGSHSRRLDRGTDTLPSGRSRHHPATIAACVTAASYQHDRQRFDAWIGSGLQRLGAAIAVKVSGDGGQLRHPYVERQLGRSETDGPYLLATLATELDARGSSPASCDLRYCSARLGLWKWEEASRKRAFVYSGDPHGWISGPKTCR